MKNKKGDFTFNTVVKLILALILLIGLIVLIWKTKTSDFNILNKITNLLRFG